MKNIRIILKAVAGLVSIIGVIVLFILCVKTLAFDYYNPRDLILTFIHIEAISGLIIVISWIMKPEYNHDRGFSDFGQFAHESMHVYCDDCDAKCHVDDEECPECGVDKHW